MVKQENEEIILDKMSEFGFNKYEAKTYMTLLEHQEISAYEISKKSGVPQSKIYETVNNLVEEGFIIAQGENPVLYSPLPLSEFISRHRTRMENSLSLLENKLKNFNSQPEVDYMWHFRGESSCYEKVQEVISRADSRLLLEVWQEEVEQIKPAVQQAAARGVEIKTVFYGQEQELPGEVFFHQLEGLKDDTENQGRWLTAVADEQEAFFGSFSAGETEAVWTQNKAFMIMAENFITHDIFIAEIHKSFSQKLQQKFGNNLKKLRNKLQL